MQALAKIKESSKTVFLVGAGRSGSTLLYKLLCLHPKVAYVSNHEQRARWYPLGVMGRLLAKRTNLKLDTWFDQNRNAYFTNRSWRKRLLPSPVEGEEVYTACGLPLFPEPGFHLNEDNAACLQDRFNRIRERLGAEVMLSKRTANNRRIAMLNAVFPEAKYIHLIRDGREVARSLAKVDWWADHKLWWSGCTASEMEQSGESRISLCAQTWVKELETLYGGLSAVQTSRILNVRYEALLAQPIDELSSVLSFLGLSMNADYQQAIESLKLTSRPERWSSEWTADERQTVEKVQRPLLRELGYL